MHRVLLAYVGGAIACVARRFAAPPPARAGVLLIDAPDVAAVVSLVRALSRADEGADALADRLTRLYRRFPPTEPAMRNLSILHQRHGDEGGARSFCVAMVLMAATEAICHGACSPKATSRHGRRHSR